MDDYTTLFICLIVILIPIISAVGALIYFDYKIEKKKAQKAAEEEEARRKTKCLVCQKCSMGHPVCDECFKRSKVLIQELPMTRTHTYESLNEYRKELMRSVIFPKTQFDLETNGIKLLSIANILKNKYYTPKAYQETYDFLKRVNDCPTNARDVLLQYYELGTQPNHTESKREEKQTSEQKEPKSKTEKETPKNNSKPFHCKDGHDVRSKAEREIDNFLFDNEVWHVYEYKYEHPVTKDWAIPDFYLPNYNLYIEYFGLNTPEYIKNREHKIKMYRSDPAIRFEYLTFEDDADIYSKLRHIFIKYNIPLK